MKKNLRLLFLGLATATFTCGFAQEDMTSSLKNADMEQGLKGWVFEVEDYETTNANGTKVTTRDFFGKNTKNPTSQIGFHGMNKGVLEEWHSDHSKPLGDGYVMQRIKGLPNGTYVFGAYAAAAKQYNVVKKDGKVVKEWENRDSIQGVTLFANDNTVRVAANNPDLAGSYKWAHSSKFNVATTVTDGTLFVGIKVENTNANYVVWDNATLYYFGEKTEAEALDAMAQIDMKNVIAIADTLVDETKGIVMNLDTLDYLKDAIAVANDTETDASTLWQDCEDLFYQIGLAHRSISDYKALKNDIEFAEGVDTGKWTTDGIGLYRGDFIKALDAAKAAYKAQLEDRAGLNKVRKTLARETGWMRVDSFNVARKVLQDFYNTPNLFTGAPGMFSKAQYNQLKALDTELADTLKKVQQAKEDDQRPQDLYPYIDRVYAAIENVKSKPIPEGYTEMPLEFKTPSGEEWLEGSEWYDEKLRIRQYASPLYRFQNKIETFRITVKHAKNNQTFFCLSELEFTDGDGKKIELTEENVTSNADHNAINPDKTDGGGIAALFDGNTNTYFHSVWENAPEGIGSHYLEIKLPNGGYDMFSFKIQSRDNTNGWDQSHTFPGSVVFNTPTPERSAMETVLNEAKALKPYMGNDPGFYTGTEAAAEFVALAAAMTAAEDLIVNNGTEADAVKIKNQLTQAVNNYKLAVDGVNLTYNVPEAGKVYRIISALPGYYEKQQVEKALTVRGDSALFWEDVCADSLGQEFMFEPILDADEFPLVEQIVTGQDESGADIIEPRYCYTLKNGKGDILEIDSLGTSKPVKLSVVEESTDTVRLKWLGVGQWNLIFKGSGSTQLHTNGHSEGAGKGNNIVGWNGDFNSASSWYIREMPELPLTVLVEGEWFKSECIHFAASDSITLTADVDCAFDGLALYDLFGTPIRFEKKVEGATAVITPERKAIACSFAFNNNEGVSSVEFNAFVDVVVEEVVDPMTRLEEKLETVVAIAPEQGKAVAQYDDITEYTAAVEAAEAMVENGSEAEVLEDAVKEMIAQLDSAVAHLKNPHMPEVGKYYFIVSGFNGWEEKVGYNVALYANSDSEVRWAQENELDSARCWSFEVPTIQELTDAVQDSAKIAKCITVNDKDTTVNVYFIKNYATGKYFGDKTGAAISLVTKREAIPYRIVMHNAGTQVGIDNVVSESRLHANGHGSGSGRFGEAIYYGGGANGASSWRIVEVEDLDFIMNTDIEVIEVEPAQVVKGIYDLFGRRLDAATAPGIYIIDGVKRVIK